MSAGRRAPEKAHAWAAEYGVPAVYTDEAAAYAAGGFDAVYIGTANHLHYAAAKRALQAGIMCCWKSPSPPQRPRRGSCLPWRTPRGWC